jgi:ABC-type transport system involved in Fe-S cluster assembly fused permease/ATPase subunit
MNIVVVLLGVVVWTASSATYSKLESPTQLFSGDEIISTLGAFKLVLTANDCALNLQSFDKATSIYTASNRKFQGSYQGACSHLKIVDNKILANGSNVFWQLSASNLSKAYLSLDDNAVIRFVGLKNPNGNPSPSDF